VSRLFDFQAGSGSGDDNGYFATVLACRPYGDMDVLAQGREKVVRFGGRPCFHVLQLKGYRTISIGT
jgi:hypothetical protein